MTLYRKYRPRSFAELVGQEQVTTPLKNALRSGNVSHAYLFCGPRGSGKTSMAKLLGKALSCLSPKDGEPCLSCSICKDAEQGRLLDILELDAASNRGIAEIREIRDHVGYAASQAKYKVYILDEAHMLTKDASNAFLKTLEEPPPHVVFVLVTTEVQKILPTILSRCQRYDFRKIDREASRERLLSIANLEGIPLSADAARYLIHRGDGSLRDSLGLLEQIASAVKPPTVIEKAHCVEVLGYLSDEVLLTLLTGLFNKDPRALLVELSRLDQSGVDARVLTRQLVEELRGMLYLLTVKDADDLVRPGSLAREAVEPLAKAFGFDRLIAILDRLSWVLDRMKGSVYFTLEMALLMELADRPAPAAIPVEEPATSPVVTKITPIKKEAPSPPPVPPPVALAGKPLEPTSVSIPDPEPTYEDPPGEKPAPAAGTSAWDALMERIRKASPPTMALLKEVVRYERKPKGLTLYVRKGHEFALMNLKGPRHSGLIREAVEVEFKEALAITIVEEDRGPAAPEPRRSRVVENPVKQAENLKGVQQIKSTFEGEVLHVGESDE